mgnify:FL=1
MCLRDSISSAGAEFNYLVGYGIDLHSHADEPGLLHHKYAILDEGTTGDPRVITGSHNWTAAAETVNDENTLVIHDATVANLFYQEWYARHNDATGIAETTSSDNMRVWPVPANNWIKVRPAADGTALITVHDATGREVLRTDANGAITVPTSDLPSGLYTVTSLQNGVRSQRLITIAR